MISCGRGPTDRIHSKGGWRIDIVYRITGYEGIIRPDHPVWNTPLPSIRKAPSVSSAPNDTNTEMITHGDYFQVVQAYLDGVGQGHIQNAFDTFHPLRTTPFHPQRMDIILEKHGEFYHPARIFIPSEDMAISLVLNVAVTPAGAAWMASEIEALQKVSKRLPPNSVPAVYGQATVPGPGKTNLPMFLANWFEGFHEFHLSIDPQSGRQRMVVWDTSSAPFFLSAGQQSEVYRRVAFMLTRAFNPLTTEQIYPWHHASGDFVLRIAGDSLDIRLITVRQYAPTMGDGKGDLDPEARLTALLVFFLNLTIRNRLDRLDGTGLPVWADAAVVPETVKGFFDALDDDQSAEFEIFLKSYRTDELMELLVLVADRYRLMPMEEDLVGGHLKSHGMLLHETLQHVLQDH
jgi:hypothetical protein